MKQITCEMCGSTEFAKQEGYFICQSCGMKYSVEEAKKMMVEVEGEPKKSFKNPHSDEIERLLKNAESTINTGNFQAAYDLYTQVLSFDPDNIMAQVQRMGCSIAQGDVTNTHLDEFDNTMIYALRNNLAKYGESKEFFDTSFAAIRRSNELIAGVFTACRNFYEENYNKSKNAGIAIGAASLLLGGGLAGAASVVGRAGDMAKLEGMVQTQSANCYNVTLHICNFMLNEVKNYENSSPEMWQYLSNMADNMVQFTNYISKNQKDAAISGVNDLKNRIQEASEKAEMLIKKAIDMVREKYWENHKEEKEKLENERKELIAKKSELLNDGKTEEDDKYNVLIESIKKLKEQQGKLGLFAVKEKKDLQTQIDAMQNDVDEISSKLEIVKKEKSAEIEILDNRIFEIDSEFEKDRR